ncbi:MAG: TrkA family potassium uptake protein [Mobilitalea sp.]
MKKFRTSKSTQFAVLGLGKFGRSVAATLYNNGFDVLCCDINEAVVHESSEYATHVMQADVTDKAVLEKIGLRNFDVVIIAFSGDFEDTCITSMIAKEMNVPYLVTKANGIRQKKILEMMGVDYVVLPETEMGEKVAYSFITNDLMSYIHSSDKYSIIEMKPLPDWVGKSLKKLRLRQTESINIIAIIRDSNVMAILDSEVELEESDNLIVLKSIK